MPEQIPYPEKDEAAAQAAQTQYEAMEAADPEAARLMLARERLAEENAKHRLGFIRPLIGRRKLNKLQNEYDEAFDDMYDREMAAVPGGRGAEERRQQHAAQLIGYEAYTRSQQEARYAVKSRWGKFLAAYHSMSGAKKIGVGAVIGVTAGALGILTGGAAGVAVGAGLVGVRAGRGYMTGAARHRAAMAESPTAEQYSQEAFAKVRDYEARAGGRRFARGELLEAAKEALRGAAAGERKEAHKSKVKAAGWVAGGIAVGNLVTAPDVIKDIPGVGRVARAMERAKEWVGERVGLGSDSQELASGESAGGGGTDSVPEVDANGDRSVTPQELRDHLSALNTDQDPTNDIGTDYIDSIQTQDDVDAFGNWTSGMEAAFNDPANANLSDDQIYNKVQNYLEATSGQGTGATEAFTETAAIADPGDYTPASPTEAPDAPVPLDQLEAEQFGPLAGEEISIEVPQGQTSAWEVLRQDARLAGLETAERERIIENILQRAREANPTLDVNNLEPGTTLTVNLNL